MQNVFNYYKEVLEDRVVYRATEEPVAIRTLEGIEYLDEIYSDIVNLSYDEDLSEEQEKRLLEYIDIKRTFTIPFLQGEIELSCKKEEVEILGINEIIKKKQCECDIKYIRSLIWVENAEDTEGIVKLKNYNISKVFKIEGTRKNPAIRFLEEYQEGMERPYYIKEEDYIFVFLDGFSGVGTEQDPYQVATPNDLNNVRNDLAGHYVQIQDIDLNVAPFSTNGWTPIHQFTGSFDGNNCKIQNLKLGSNGGLFHTVFNGAKIKNVYVKDMDMDTRQGAAIAYVVGGALIENCTVENLHDNLDMTHLRPHRAGLIYSLNITGIVRSCKVIDTNFLPTGNGTHSGLINTIYAHRSNTMTGYNQNLSVADELLVEECFVENCSFNGGTATGRNNVGNALFNIIDMVDRAAGVQGPFPATIRNCYAKNISLYNRVNYTSLVRQISNSNTVDTKILYENCYVVSDRHVNSISQLYFKSMWQVIERTNGPIETNNLYWYCNNRPNMDVLPTYTFNSSNVSDINERSKFSYEMTPTEIEI